MKILITEIQFNNLKNIFKKKENPTSKFTKWISEKISKIIRIDSLKHYVNREGVNKWMDNGICVLSFNRRSKILIVRPNIWREIQETISGSHEETSKFIKMWANERLGLKNIIPQAGGGWDKEFGGE